MFIHTAKAHQANIRVRPGNMGLLTWPGAKSAIEQRKGGERWASKSRVGKKSGLLMLYELGEASQIIRARNPLNDVAEQEVYQIWS